MVFFSEILAKRPAGEYCFQFTHSLPAGDLRHLPMLKNISNVEVATLYFDLTSKSFVI